MYGLWNLFHKDLWMGFNNDQELCYKWWCMIDLVYWCWFGVCLFSFLASSKDGMFSSYLGMSMYSVPCLSSLCVVYWKFGISIASCSDCNNTLFITSSFWKFSIVYIIVWLRFKNNLLYSISSLPSSSSHEDIQIEENRQLRAESKPLKVLSWSKGWLYAAKI